jgi:hypothetical protein
VLGCAPAAACGLFQGPWSDEQREQPDRSNCHGYHRKAERFNAASSHDKIKLLRARKVPFSPFDKVSPALALFCCYRIALFKFKNSIHPKAASIAAPSRSIKNGFCSTGQSRNASGTPGVP